MKLRHLLQSDACDHLIHEPLARCVHDPQPRVVTHEAAADGVHEMRLTHPYAAVDVERVVLLRRFVGHSLGRRVGELITGTDHERIESKPRVQLRHGFLEHHFGFQRPATPRCSGPSQRRSRFED